MPIDHVDTLLEVLEESQLLTAAQLQECRSGQLSFADTKALARHLLQRDWLTPYQVNHLLQGKAGELFLDNYVLLERIGQGGMGQVFRAKHRIMNRVVALKIIRPERLANPDLVKRFRREIQLAGQLAHPNIVIAYDAAEQHGTHFLVMEFVEGIDLARFVEKNGRRPVAQASEWIRQVSLGLQHAHERGMVHRDVKPANLLLAVKENVVKVLDMGLARLSQGSEMEQTGAGLTQEGTVMGTPDYMAPEQAEESTGVDIRADIYSLGCTLYFLLAGHAPFPGGTLAQKLRKHAQAEPEPLERQRDDVPAGLSAVVRKMMAKRPDDRYQTPGDVALALDPFCRTGPVLAVPVAVARPVAVPLSQESIAALQQPIDGSAQAGETIPPSVLDSVPSVTLQKPQTPLARVQHAWGRLGRRGQVIAGAGAAVVLLALLIVLFSHKSPHPTIEPERPLSVLERLDPAKIPPEDRPGWQSKELKAVVVAVLSEHRVRIAGYVCMALSPDRKTVAVADGGVIRLVDTRTLRQERELTGHTSTVYCLAFSANGKYLASGGADNSARLWEAGSGKPLQKLAHDSPVRAVALTPDGKEVLSACDDPRVYVWDAGKGERLRTFTGHTTPVRALVVAPDGRLAYSAGGTTEVGKSDDRDVRIWEVATAKAARAGDDDRLLTGHKGYVNRLEISPDGKRLLAGGDRSEVAVWDLAEGSLQPRSLTVLDPANAVTYGTFVGDDRVATWTGGKIRLWEPNGRGGYQDLDPIPPQATAAGLAWLPAVPRDNSPGAETDNGLLFVMDGTLRVWDLKWKKEWRPPLGHTQPARGLTFLGDGDRLVSYGDDRTVRSWDLAELYDPATGWPRESRPTLSAPGTGGYAFLGAPVSSDGNLVLTLVNSEKFVTVWVWENNKWNPVRKLEVKDAANADALTAVALSEDGTRALTAGTDKALRFWDVKRAVELKKIEGLPNLCTVVRLLPEGRAYTWDGTELRLWEGLGDADKPSFVAAPVRGSAVTVSPGREMAIVGEGDGHMERLTDLARGKPLRLTLDWWQKGTISALSLAPDRKAFLAGSGGDGPTGPRVGLWDLTGDPIAKPQLWEVRGAPTGLTFAPDGRHAALANPDGTIYILRLPVGK